MLGLVWDSESQGLSVPGRGGGGREREREGG